MSWGVPVRDSVYYQVAEAALHLRDQFTARAVSEFTGLSEGTAFAALGWLEEDGFLAWDASQEPARFSLVEDAVAVAQLEHDIEQFQGEESEV